MEKFTVYHNPRCSKSRMALSHLEDMGATVEVIEYLKSIPSKEEMKSVLKKLNMPAIDIIRKGEQEYKDNFKDKELSNDEWIDAMVKYPKLIERPIVIKSNKAVVARPAERIDELTYKSKSMYV